MEKGRVPKKRDFFSGGQGIDSFDESSNQESDSFCSDMRVNDDEDSYGSPPPSTSNIYVNEEPPHESSVCSHPHIYDRSPSPPSSYFPPFPPNLPTDHRHPYGGIQSSHHHPLYLPQSVQPPTIPSPSHLSSLYPQLPSHIPCPMQGVLPTHPIYSKPTYPDTYLSEVDAYSPLRNCPLGHVNPNEVRNVINIYDQPPVVIGGNIYPDMQPAGMSGISERLSLIESQKKKRKQECSLCLNHELHVEVKGHKWYCPFRKCECDRCKITRGRQHHMKEQQKLTRALNRTNM